ncbi:hypothetical protein [Stenotrophomonas pictorum]|uniref:hypothetical protein n=1 Tax=Stenotrophomonas pictorum TaxID=86184 RepID=UPI0012FE3F1B|nr:hypothetical protein [Stenotrophomonas pictorum]
MPSIAAERGNKARVSERSEFRAAPFREKRRAPMRLYRIGMRPAEAVWFLLPQPKGTRLRSRRKPLLSSLNLEKPRQNSFRAPAVRESL